MIEEHSTWNSNPNGYGRPYSDKAPVIILTGNLMKLFNIMDQKIKMSVRQINTKHRYKTFWDVNIHYKSIYVIRTTILFIFVVLFTNANLFANSNQVNISVHGAIYDSVTGESIAGVYISVSNSRIGTMSDDEGHFKLSVPSRHITLIFSHVGYQRYSLSLHEIIDLHEHLTITLIPVSIESDALLITANRTNTGYNGINNDLRTRSVDDYLSSAAGLDLVSRANMARDPVVRGLRDRRVAIMVDGMRLTPACVDGMDPATAYVETDNLNSIEINRGFDIESSIGASKGPAVNFSLRKPKLTSGLNVSTETAYQSASRQVVQQGSMTIGTETLAFRLSGTYRNSNDYYAGDGVKIEGSGFSKGNILTSVLYSPTENHELNFRYIADLAGKIGYPNLIMDTRKAAAHIVGLEHSWNNPIPHILSIKTNLYTNTVVHEMDDYDRDVTKRSVMPNMFMPMYGKTITTGLSSEATFNKQNHYATFQLESYQIHAFADMLMEHINPSVSDMYLVNLGDVIQQHITMAASYRYISPSSWHFGGRINLNGERNRITESSARATYQAEYPQIETLDPVGFAYLAGLSIEKVLSDNFRIGASHNYSSRLADHMERYGYYIYQPVDGFFYIGNPGLRPEKSRKSEIFMQFGSSTTILSGSLSVWFNQMDNYIAGLKLDSMFKRYDNMGSSTLTGFETEVTSHITQHWKVGAMISYVHGIHHELDEPLPMIPPLKGSAFIQHHSDWIQVEGRIRWAASQDRIAIRNSLESRTDDFMLFDFYLKKRFSRYVSIHLGVENVLDHYYVEHLSVNKIPSTGRNIIFSIRLNI